MNVQAKVALDKEEHPEKYCPIKRCLWVITRLAQPGSSLRVLKDDCMTGYCPRHKHLAGGGEMNLLGAEKHLELCCACNHGRTPCEEYRRNYEKPASVASVERADGKNSALDNGTGTETKTEQDE